MTSSAFCVAQAAGAPDVRPPVRRQTGNPTARPLAYDKAGHNASPSRTDYASVLRPCLALAGALVLLAGCASLDLNKGIPWSKDQPGKTPAARMALLWSDAVMTPPGGPPTRGFGGRLMFYGPKDDKPIQVRGTLVVYAFDEQGRDPTDAKPDRKYVFTDEQFAKHYSKSELGHSYSVWIPWDEVGGPRKEISLIARFLPSDGSVVIGDQSRHVLPGRAPTEAELARHRPPPQAGDAGAQTVRPGAYEEQLDGVGQPARRTQRSPGILTTTIDLPPRYGHHWPVAEASPRVNLPPEAGQTTEGSRSSLGAASPTATPASTRFAPRRPRALGEPIARLSRDRGPWQPPPATWPPRSPATPPAPSGTDPSSQAAPSTGN